MKFIFVFVLGLLIFQPNVISAQENKVVVIPLLKTGTPTEVIFTETSAVGNSVEFVSEFFPTTAANIAQTFTTNQAGRLQISMLASISMGCSPSNSAVRYFYLLLDGEPIKSSLAIGFDSNQLPFRLMGTTEGILPAGTYTITPGGECDASNTPSSSGVGFVSNAVIFVLPD